MSNQLENTLLNVRKAYALLEDYQQRVIELIDFVRKELGAVHYFHRFHGDMSRGLNGIYSRNDAGRSFLPLLDMSFLWLNAENRADAYCNHQPGDLLIDARVCSNTANSWPDFADGLPDSGNTELRLYVLQCITPVSDKYNWFYNVWDNIEPEDYDKFKELINCRRHEGKCQMYADSFDLVELGDEKAVRDSMSEFKRRVMEAFRPKCSVNRFDPK